MGAWLKQYLWILDLVAILLCAFFGAKLTHIYLAQKIIVEQPVSRPVETPPKKVMAEIESVSPDFYGVIVQRNIFDSTELPPAEAPEEVAESVTPTDEAVKTSLGIKVVGVLVVGKGTDGRSSAMIAGDGGSVSTYAVGDKESFAPNTKLTRVQPDRIEFIHSGRLEYALVNEEETASIFGPPPQTNGPETEAMASPPAEGPGEAIHKAGENRFVIDQREIQKALGNIEMLYTEIRAVPNFAGGKVAGMKILSVKQGSLFDKLGLQRGDILERINGLEVDVKRGFEIFNQLKNEKSLTVDLVRRGANQTFEYEIR